MLLSLLLPFLSRFVRFLSPSRFCLVDRNIIYAIAHVRGGGELGEKWYLEGKLKYREDIVEGLDNMVEAFQGLLRGDNFGKLLIKVN